MFYFPFPVSFRGSRLDGETSGYIFFVGKLSMSFGLVGLLFAFGLQCLPAQTSLTQPVTPGRIFLVVFALSVRAHTSSKDHPSFTLLRLRAHQLGEARWMQRGLLRLSATPVVISVN